MFQTNVKYESRRDVCAAIEEALMSSMMKLDQHAEGLITTGELIQSNLRALASISANTFLCEHTEIPAECWICKR